jgi:hypothetical protein
MQETGTMTDDTDFSEDDCSHVQQLEALMLARGYKRNAHGFWVLPDAATATTQQVATEDKN